MKELLNKTTNLPVEEGKEKIQYSDIIKIVLDIPPQSGFSFSEMKKRERIANAVDRATDKIELEDADASNLKSMLDYVTLKIRHKDLVVFYEDVKAL